MKTTRTYDVVLYGATGFVGRQTVAYFARHERTQKHGLRWALAGRSASKLEEVRDACGAKAAGIIVADAGDAKVERIPDRDIEKLIADHLLVIGDADPVWRFEQRPIGKAHDQGGHDRPGVE